MKWKVLNILQKSFTSYPTDFSSITNDQWQYDINLIRGTQSAQIQNGANRKTILKTTLSHAIWNPIGLTFLSVAIDITLSANLAKNLLPHISLSLTGLTPFFLFRNLFRFCLIVLNTFPTSGPHPCLSRPPVVGTLLYGNEPHCSSEQAFYPELRGNEYIWTVFPLSYCARAPRWEI